MLALRRAEVVGADPAGRGEQELTISGDGVRRRAVADVALVGTAEVGDEVIVNVQARELGLGSGGFDIVHVNLTRGLVGSGQAEAHVMKLNYTSLQHAVHPLDSRELTLAPGRPVAVLALHGQLAALAWAFARRVPGGRLGYVQTAGGALPGSHSRDVRRLRADGLLAGHLTAGPTFGGEGETITVAGALSHGFAQAGWDGAVCGPGPGIVGSASALGHGGLAALDTAHTALALGCRTLLGARMSQSDPRQRHRGLSHHTRTVLELLLEPVSVAVPESAWPNIAELTRPVGSTSLGAQRLARHHWRRAAVHLADYAASGRATETMGRSITEDPLFFSAALAAGTVLGDLCDEALPGDQRQPVHRREEHQA